MKNLIFPIMILCVFGTAFISLLVHESIHIAQSKNPYSVCYDIGKNSFMRVTHNVSGLNDEELDRFLTVTELTAGVIEMLMSILIGVGIGAIGMCYIYEGRKKDEN